MKEFDVRKDNKLEDPDIIRFADDNSGFEACYIQKNDDGFEFDSAYVRKEDFSNMIEALKIVKSLGWDK